MTRPGLADRVRFGIGATCVAVAAALFAVHVPRTIRSMNGTVRYLSYLKTPSDRVFTTGDSLDIPLELQVEALALIPQGSDYALLLPPDEQTAGTDGIGSITYATVGPFLRYLLLPAVPADPAEAHYVICWHCDTSALDGHTTWLWKGDQGDAIGRAGS